MQSPHSPLPLSSHPGCNPHCRACHYKALDYPAQLERKQRWADEQLASWRDRLLHLIAAPEGERIGYRSKSWMRSSAVGGELSFGMFRSVRSEARPGRWDQEFVSWNSCPLHSEPIRETMAKLRALLTSEAPEFARSSLVGIWFGAPHVVIISRDTRPEAIASIDWAAILTAPFDRVWFHVNSQVGAKIFGHQEIRLLAGPSAGSSHPVRAFRQAAQTLLVQARNRAVEFLLNTHPGMVLDLYCGTGDLSLLLPREVGWIGIEQSRDAVAFASSLRPPHASTHLAYTGAVEQRLEDPRILARIQEPYALYINPPRSGLSPEARARILRLIREKPPSAIAYLSCSASSLARDLPPLEDAGFRVESLQPYDFFPQTEHFETLALLTPAPAL